MSAISNIMTCGGRREPAVNCIDKKNLDFGLNWRATSSRTRISMPFQKNEFQLGTEGKSSRGNKEKRSIRMALVDERVVYGRDTAGRPAVLAYDLVQVPLVKWGSATGKSKPDPPTAVLLHGILGSRKNWVYRFKISQEPLHGDWHKNFQHGSMTEDYNRPMFQPYEAIRFHGLHFLLVDLRCHGDSASIRKRGPHTVASTAFDVLKLVAQLRITPRVLIGHSFGGKVALSMVEQAAKPLAQSVRVWSLDATPGKVRAGGDGEDHPAELISFIRKLPKEVFSKRDIVNALIQEGFSKDIAQWVVTNLKTNGPPGSPSSSFSWMFDLDGISEMYQSYEETNLKFVENLPQGVHVNFLKAERSLHRWALEDLQRIHAAEDLAAEEGAGVEMHVLEDAGHWVHADNPDGLFRILSSSFQGFKA
ncbi:protein ABHD11 [Populus alba x Populus x berolinensis]|nr:protein ABHD11 [Populus alba x Populus x berolinensis]